MKKKRKCADVCLLVATLVAALQTPVVGQEMRPPMTFVVVIDVSGSMKDKFPAPIQPNLPDSTKLLAWIFHRPFFEVVFLRGGHFSALPVGFFEIGAQCPLTPKLSQS